jgi:hypothetical protein
MNRVENLEGKVKQLTGEELKAFREWFAQFDAEAWDRQFASDVQNGKLDKAAAEALRDYKGGGLPNCESSGGSRLLGPLQCSPRSASGAGR